MQELSIIPSEDKKYKKKIKNRKKKVILLMIAFIVIITITVIGLIIAKYLGKINFSFIDKSELSVNENLYDEMSEQITKEQFNNVKKLVLFGIDSQNPEFENDEGRSDCIIIVAIDKNTSKLKLISIPRDTYANVDGIGYTKINQAYAVGKEQLAIKTINETFNLDLTDYVTIDFSGLIHIINDIGGIELTITKEERDFINGSKLAYRLSGKEHKTLYQYGKVTLDGEQALTHSRNRTVGDDFTRAGRQREVIQAMLNKISQMDIKQISSIIEDLLKEVTTNINLAEYIGIGMDILQSRESYLKDIVSAQVPSKDYATGQYIKGIYYFVPSDTEKMKEDMRNRLYN